ncbi:MAG: prolyl oligopeptidase family serine peptidase [Actinomycetota bacterium]
MSPTPAAHGSWSSPLTVAEMTSAVVRLSPPRIDGDATYWKETGGDGRGVIVRAANGVHETVTTVHANGSSVDVASKVHEYGGRDFDVADGVCVFSERADSRLYVTVAGDDGWSVPRPVTPSGVRYADLTLTGHVVHAVAEIHGETVVNALARVDVPGGAVTQLRAEADFVANPQPNPSGTALAWYEWDHPDMPWDATRLMVAEIDGDRLGNVRQIAGGPGVSAISPVWVTDEDLVYVADPDGWWNVHRCTDPLGECRIRLLHPAEAEFASPPWTFDRSLAVLDEDHLVCRWTRFGRWTLGSMRLSNGELEEWITGLEVGSEVAAGGGRVAFVGRHANRPEVLAELILAEGSVRELRVSAPAVLADQWVSQAEPVDWGAGDSVAHGFFYPPVNPDFAAPDGELPPLLVLVHGGPTTATAGTFSPGVQFWTTRGFAVLDVNHRGSTGYGREFRDALRGQWGVADIADIAAGVTALVDRGLVDGARAAIRGGSAGGYAVLRALTATDVFSAGTSRYGIADLALLAGDTHKFESRYVDGLVGPWPEAAEVYRERSPLFHLDQLRAPVLLLQGEEDAVVPSNQARQMADAIREAGGDVELVLYPGEGHGFRRAETTRDALARELAFYGRVFGFTPA